MLTSGNFLLQYSFEATSVFIWTNADPIHWHIYAALGGPLNKMAAILQMTFSNAFSWMFSILIQISLKFVPKGPIDNKWALDQVMAWRRIGDKPLPEPMLIQFTDAYMRH